MINIRSAVHQFEDLDTTKFIPAEYSKLKFGSNSIARKYGTELAKDVFTKHADVLLANRLVVIPSPYNHVRNAATIMTHHFVNEINHLLVSANGSHVEYSVIHRKVSYINDYGFLTKEKRKGLINNDSFYLNEEFYRDKLLIFVDDVRITGTHEEKLMDILGEKGFDNDRMFLYYADYSGDSPEIESKINFAGMNSVEDYIKLAEEPDHNIIVRPIKYLLSLPTEDLLDVIGCIPIEKVREIYYGALGEGYYKIPNYQDNLQTIKHNI